MNMIQKIYPCVYPLFSADPQYNSLAQEYDISAWQAMGSDTVNIRMRNPWGWGDMVISEKLSNYAHAGIKTMDALIDYLYWVVRA